MGKHHYFSRRFLIAQVVRTSDFPPHLDAKALSWCPFVGAACSPWWLRRKSGIYWIISTISFSILCFCWKHPIQAHQPGPTLLKLARSDEIIARKRWQCRSVRDSKKTYYEPHHSLPRWESEVDGQTTVQTMKPTRRAKPDLSMPLRYWAKPPLFQPRMKWHTCRNQSCLPQFVHKDGYWMMSRAFSQPHQKPGMAYAPMLVY